MKNFTILAVVSCLAAVTYGSVLMQSGFKDASRTFNGYENKPRRDVEKELSLILPNVQFKVYKDPKQNEVSEEAFFGMIRLVVNKDDVVILPPYFYGTEPDLSFAADLIGKDKEIAVDDIARRIPGIKIVIRTKDGALVWESVSNKEDYILIEVSEDSLVTELLKFVRVP